MSDEILKNEKRWLLEEKYGGNVLAKESSEYLSDIKKLESGYPVAYLIGNVDFLGCHIDLESKPLIPRPETEFWVKEIIDEHKNSESLKVLDLFSGSGCIGLSILKNINNCQVDFGELKQEHVDQIDKNISINSLDNTAYNVYQSDVLSSIPEGEYDLILTNPPYIDKTKKETVQISVLDNEDPDALFADDQGLFFVKKIIDEGFTYLKDGGKIYIEYDPWQTDLIREYLDSKGISKYKYWKDQFGKNRVVIIEK